ncbi:MAG: type IX secretion system membrane protein PorP/SprF [Flavobacteriaceae bacterium]|nr:type IX secretion system membrane protein PorP/SprF [Flavobacteriaceae bacterium]
MFTTTILIGSNFDVSTLYRLNNYMVSFNISNILDKDDRFFSGNEPLKLSRYSLFNSYVFTRFYGDFEIEPSVLVEYFEADKRSRTDINLKFRKKTSDGYIWAGLSYNFLNDQLLKPNTIAPLVGLKKGNFYASYGFGINTNRTQNFNAGSHMVTLGFDLRRRESLARCTQKYYMFQ